MVKGVQLQTLNDTINTDVVIVLMWWYMCTNDYGSVGKQCNRLLLLKYCTKMVIYSRIIAISSYKFLLGILTNRNATYLIIICKWRKLNISQTHINKLNENKSTIYLFNWQFYILFEWTHINNFIVRFRNLQRIGIRVNNYRRYRVGGAVGLNVSIAWEG